ncbi:hypothetical protein MNV49_006935 [Pseudohyphozyma bogoriensis]|nr:hypothetical protein MNV49_006935 [Pseudohyphozyma bogoriensis]
MTSVLPHRRPSAPPAGPGLARVRSKKRHVAVGAISTPLENAALGDGRPLERSDSARDAVGPSHPRFDSSLVPPRDGRADDTSDTAPARTSFEPTHPFAVAGLLRAQGSSSPSRPLPMRGPPSNPPPTPPPAIPLPPLQTTNLPKMWMQDSPKRRFPRPPLSDIISSNSLVTLNNAPASASVATSVSASEGPSTTVSSRWDPFPYHLEDTDDGPVVSHQNKVLQDNRPPPPSSETLNDRGHMRADSARDTLRDILSGGSNLPAPPPPPPTLTTSTLPVRKDSLREKTRLTPVPDISYFPAPPTPLPHEFDAALSASLAIPDLAPLAIGVGSDLRLFSNSLKSGWDDDDTFKSSRKRRKESEKRARAAARARQRQGDAAEQDVELLPDMEELLSHTPRFSLGTLLKEVEYVQADHERKAEVPSRDAPHGRFLPETLAQDVQALLSASQQPPKPKRKGLGRLFHRKSVDDDPVIATSHPPSHSKSASDGSQSAPLSSSTKSSSKPRNRLRKRKPPKVGEGRQLGDESFPRLAANGEVAEVGVDPQKLLPRSHRRHGSQNQAWTSEWIDAHAVRNAHRRSSSLPAEFSSTPIDLDGSHPIIMRLPVDRREDRSHGGRHGGKEARQGRIADWVRGVEVVPSAKEAEVDVEEDSRPQTYGILPARDSTELASPAPAFGQQYHRGSPSSSIVPRSSSLDSPPPLRFRSNFDIPSASAADDLPRTPTELVVFDGQAGAPTRQRAAREESPETYSLEVGGYMLSTFTPPHPPPSNAPPPLASRHRPRHEIAAAARLERSRSTDSVLDPHAFPLSPSIGTGVSSGFSLSTAAEAELFFVSPQPKSHHREPSEVEEAQVAAVQRGVKRTGSLVKTSSLSRKGSSRRNAHSQESSAVVSGYSDETAPSGAQTSPVR